MDKKETKNGIINEMRTHRIFSVLLIGLFLFKPGFFASAQTSREPVSLYISPPSGTVTVGSTFSVSFYLNTGNQFINAIEAHVAFPQDKLQVVSPTTGSSFVSVWTAQPTYSNIDGTMTFTGAVPSPGVSTSAGLISTVTFRVKSVGSALIKFSDKSRVLLNDGQGTDVLSKTSGAVYTLVLPPPAGPAVSSFTHPDQSSWYASDNVELRWQDSGEDGYSYMLSFAPIDIPDDISEGARTSVVYKNVSDGVQYFHIKALRDGVWGGVTHYAVKVDVSPPAVFRVNLSPGTRTSNKNPIITFATTDAASGLSHYEVSLIPLSSISADKKFLQGINERGFFIEASSPYVPHLELGKYDVVVHAFDQAGNMREIIQQLNIVNPLFQFTSADGLIISGGLLVIPWLIVWIMMLAMMGVAGYLARIFWRHHLDVHGRLTQGVLNDPIIKERLRVLSEKQKQYGKALVILLCVIIGASMFGHPAQAQTTNTVAPPVVTVVSKNISNQDLLYVGGQTPFGGATVIVYLQDTTTGAVSTFEAPVDSRGTWFYSHDKFLAAGEYVMWLQTKVGNQISPPSSQLSLNVTQTAIELGSSRLSYEFIYLIIAIILLIIVFTQIGFAVYHYGQAKRKRATLGAQMKDAEESIRRGFAIIRHDIENELKVIHQAKLRGPLAEAEKLQEEALLKDIELINSHLGKEIWELEHLEV